MWGCFLAAVASVVASVVVAVVANDVSGCLFIFQSEDDDSASVTASSVTVSVCGFVCVSVITAKSITVHTHWVETDLLSTPHVVPMAMSHHGRGPDRLLIGCDGLPLLSDWNQQGSLL